MQKFMKIENLSYHNCDEETVLKMLSDIHKLKCVTSARKCLQNFVKKENGLFKYIVTGDGNLGFI